MVLVECACGSKFPPDLPRCPQCWTPVIKAAQETAETVSAGTVPWPEAQPDWPEAQPESPAPPTFSTLT